MESFFNTLFFTSFIFAIIISIIGQCFYFCLFKNIKTKEIKFLSNHTKIDSMFRSVKSQLWWIIYFGKYRDIKNKDIKLKCKTQQILFIAGTLFFVIGTFSLIYLWVFFPIKG